MMLACWMHARFQNVNETVEICMILTICGFGGVCYVDCACGHAANVKIISEQSCMRFVMFPIGNL